MNIHVYVRTVYATEAGTWLLPELVVSWVRRWFSGTTHWVAGLFPVQRHGGRVAGVRVRDCRCLYDSSSSDTATYCDTATINTTQYKTQYKLYAIMVMPACRLVHHQITYTPPTPTRLNCRVASASAVCSEFATSSRRLPTDSVDNLETGHSGLTTWIFIDTDNFFSTMTSLCRHLSPISIA